MNRSDVNGFKKKRKKKTIISVCQRPHGEITVSVHDALNGCFYPAHAWHFLIWNHHPPEECKCLRNVMVRLTQYWPLGAQGSCPAWTPHGVGRIKTCEGLHDESSGNPAISPRTSAIRSHSFVPERVGFSGWMRGVKWGMNAWETGWKTAACVQQPHFSCLMGIFASWKCEQNTRQTGFNEAI